jgi:hypothetical protein
LIARRGGQVVFVGLVALRGEIDLVTGIATSVLQGFTRLLSGVRTGRRPTILVEPLEGAERHSGVMGM